MDAELIDALPRWTGGRLTYDTARRVLAYDDGETRLGVALDQADLRRRLQALLLSAADVDHGLTPLHAAITLLEQEIVRRARTGLDDVA